MPLGVLNPSGVPCRGGRVPRVALRLATLAQGNPGLIWNDRCQARKDSPARFLSSAAGQEPQIRGRRSRTLRRRVTLIFVDYRRRRRQSQHAGVPSGASAVYKRESGGAASCRIAPSRIAPIRAVIHPSSNPHLLSSTAMFLSASAGGDAPGGRASDAALAAGGCRAAAWGGRRGRRQRSCGDLGRQTAGSVRSA